MKKKFLTIMVAISMMAMCLTACGKGEEASKDAKTSVEDSKKEDKNDKKDSEKEDKDDKKDSEKEDENKDWSKAYDDYFERENIIGNNVEMKTVANANGIEYEMTVAKAGDMTRMNYQFDTAVFDMYANSEKVYAYWEAGGEAQWLWCPANEEEVNDMTDGSFEVLDTESLVSWNYREAVTEDGIVYDVLDVVSVDEEVSTAYYINRETQKIAKCMVKDGVVSAVCVVNEIKSITLPSDADAAVESNMSEISMYMLGVMMRGAGVAEE